MTNNYTLEKKRTLNQNTISKIIFTVIAIKLSFFDNIFYSKRNYPTKNLGKNYEHIFRENVRHKI